MIEVRTCRHCDRAIIWGYVDYSDTEGWVHTEDDEALCRIGDKDSPEAEPTGASR